jgi:hypothetical protein
MSWSSLPTAAKWFRIAHAGWSAVSLACLANIWASAVRRRLDRRTWLAIGFLGVEGGALVVGRGDCPLGPFQHRLGDPVPLFELVLPPRAAKAAVPVLAGVSLAGIGAVLLRSASGR